MTRAILLSLILLITLTGCSKSTPTSCYEKMVKAVATKKWGTVYDSYTTTFQRKQDEQLLFAAKLQTALIDNSDSTAAAKERKAVDALLSMDPRDRFVAMMSDLENEEDAIAPEDYGVVLSEAITGDSATIAIRIDSVESTKILRIESGKWRLTH